MRDAERVLTALRPTTHVDPAWADSELRRIMEAPSTPSRRRWWMAGGSATAVIAIGGTAYAGGLVPGVVAERLGDGDQAQPIHRIGEVRQVFELTTRDGVNVRYFAARNDAGGQCWTVARDLAPDADPEDLGYTCISGPAAGFTPPDDDGVGVVPTDSENPGAPILFGLDIGDFEFPPGTRQVRVTGPGLDRNISTRAPEGWAIELPADTAGASYIVEFLTREGSVLRQVAEHVE